MLLKLFLDFMKNKKNHYNLSKRFSASFLPEQFATSELAKDPLREPGT